MVEGWLAAIRVLAALPSYRHLVASASLHPFAFSGSMIWYPPFLTRVHELSPGEIGTTLALYSSLPAGLGIFFGGIATDRLARRDVRWLQGYAGVTILLFVPFALGFLFLPGRGAAFACFWLSLVIGILGAAINFGIGQPGWGVALAVYAVLSSVGYGETIKWMDRHEAWGLNQI